MKTLSSEPEIIAMARALRLVGDPVESIVNFCRTKIAKWAEGIKIRTIWELERIVCGKLNLVIHEVWKDADLEEIIKRYVEEGDIVFAHLKADLDDKTFATLIRRKPLQSKAEERYVAVIDCRGAKGARRFFSHWHEIAHLLTLYKQMELPLHRSTIDRDPTEKLMDIIAGEVGFYEPIFRPTLEAEIKSCGGLTLDVVEHVRKEFCPDASFQATLNACATRCSLPVIVLEIGMGHKKSELRELNSRQIMLLPRKRPDAKLRVLSAMPNGAARQISFQIPRYMRVPSTCILTAVFKRENASLSNTTQAVENLNVWSSSDAQDFQTSRSTFRLLRQANTFWQLFRPCSDCANTSIFLGREVQRASRAVG